MKIKWDKTPFVDVKSQKFYDPFDVVKEIQVKHKEEKKKKVYENFYLNEKKKKVYENFYLNEKKKKI